MGLFARDGHLLDLSLERGAAQDLSPAEMQEVSTHLRDCGACQARADFLKQPVELPALRRKSGERPMLQLLPGGASRGAPVPPPVPVVPTRRWWLVPAIAIAAAILLVFTIPTERFTVRGGGDLGMEVYRETSGVSQRLMDGDPVAAGDKLGFRIRSDTGGYLMIHGQDGRGNTYACYPQDLASPAQPVAGGPDAMPLPAAIQMDATPGEEVLTATRCPMPFDFSQVIRSDLPAGCTQIHLSLRKQPP